MQKIWKMFPELTKTVRETHLQVGLVGWGHDFEHAVRVAQCAIKIAENEYIGRLAGIAGLCHNADRILEYKLYKENNTKTKKDVLPSEISALIKNWLNFLPFRFLNYDERDSIIAAILKHDKANEPTDSAICIALMDADRIVNAEIDCIIRSVQHRPDISAIDFVQWLNDPTATYREPKSILRGLNYALEWEDHPKFGLRLPKAQVMGESRFQYIRQYIDILHSQLKESGLIPYPF